MKEIARLLLAFYGTCKNVHYNGRGDKYYSQHLLGDRLIDELDPFDVIDHMQECTLLGHNKAFLNWNDIICNDYVGDSIEHLKDLLEALEEEISNQKFDKGDESYWTGVLDKVNMCKGFVYRSMKQ